MEWVRNRAASREFERFAAEASDALLHTGFLMTGNAAAGAAGTGCGRWTTPPPMPAGF